MTRQPHNKRLILINRYPGSCWRSLRFLFILAFFSMACGLDTFTLAPLPTAMPTAAPIQPSNEQPAIPTPTLARPASPATVELAGTPTPSLSFSALSPLTLAPERQLDLGADVIRLALIDLTGGGLPDIVAADAEQRVHAINSRWPSFNQWFNGHTAVIQTGDMNQNGLGDIFLGGSDGTITAMEADFNRGAFVMRGTYTAPGGITAVAAITAYDAHNLIVATANGQILSFKFPLDLNWSHNATDNGRVTLIQPHALLENSTNLLVGTSDGRLLALNAGGSRQWDRELPAAITAIALIDISGDGKDDLVVGDEQGNLVAFNYWGMELWRWSADGAVVNLQTANLTADSPPVLLLGSRSGVGKVAALDKNGNLLWQSNVGYPVTALDVGDVDGNGRAEIAVATADGTILLLDSEGALRSLYALPAPAAHLQIAQLDAGARPRLVAAAGSIVYLLEATTGETMASLPATPDPSRILATETPFPSALATPAPPVSSLPPRPHYLLDVDLDYFQRTVYVTTTVTIPNQTGDEWSEIVFHASPLYWRDLFNLIESTVTLDEQTAVVTPTIRTTMIHIPLPRPVSPGEAVIVEFQYALFLPRLNPLGWGPVGNAGWGPDVIQMGDWYPALIPYDESSGEWQTWDYRPVGDPVRSALADFEAQITTSANVILAAPGFLRTEGQTRHYRLEKGRAFSFLASPSYIIFEGQSQAAPVKLYVLAKHERIGPTVLENIIRSLNLFHAQFGLYPYPELIMAENGFLTAMEYSAIVSLSSFAFTAYDGTPQSLLTALTAHEVAHQWWYGAVGNDQVLQPWLDESLSMYGELLYYETYHPEHVDWWWQFRVDRWRPTGYVDVTIYDYNNSEIFVHNMYGRSAHFIHDLRTQMGVYNFNLFLQEYYRRYRFQTATTADFLTLAQSYAGVDLRPLFRVYFRELPPGLE
jgi:hypothetical protein